MLTGGQPLAVASGPRPIWGASEGETQPLARAAQAARASAVAPAIQIRELSLGKVDRDAWDAFAIACDVSARGMCQRLIAWQVKQIFRYRLRLFELFDNATPVRRKIGQCAVGVRRDGRCLFLPRLQIRAADQAHWSAAMQALLPAIDARSLRYGWELNLERPREADLARIPGVEIAAVRPITVHAVDFSQWRSWDDYYRHVSENSRRNAKAAEKRHPDLELLIRTGRGSVELLPALVRMKSDQVRRKGLNLSAASLAVSYVASAIAEPEHLLSAAVRAGGRTLSAAFGWEVGGNFWYLDAASAPDNGGAAWTLLLALLKRTYERNPSGKFIMGYVDYARHDEAQGGGLLRSRHACRVTDYPTSIVEFRYAAP